ncbi:hypothetical protein EZV62_011787 [Acer yangbiense]|uniref:Dirigent protein n=1 Tax=Acer yangbiense TaxID=1000413 RepID=A0A5C7I5J3_9ROSI|nr:hypothetical protein EZV62_011787 [Acer yangbiense]
MTNLQFYFHDTLSGKNPSAVRVAQASKTTNKSASQAELGLLMVFNFGFTEGMYKGSSIYILGLNSAMNPVREMSIVGGTGIFRLARGYAIAQTNWFDPASGHDAIVGYNVTIVH